MTLGAEASKERYKEHKDFFKNGIKDKNKYPGWYIMGMYIATYHLTCYYFQKKFSGNRFGVSEKDWEDVYNLNGKLNILSNDFRVFKNCCNRFLFSSLSASVQDVRVAENAFLKLEQELLAS